MLDRSVAPAFKRITSVSLPEVKHTHLDNGRILFYLQDGNLEGFKIELLIRAGSWYTERYVLVPLTLKMLNEGTTKRNSKQLAEAFDKLGSFLELSPAFDNSAISVYGLTKYFEENLQLIAEVVESPALEVEALNRLKEREIQRLQLNQQKSNYLASVELRQSIFGKDHPYGRLIQKDNIDQLTIDHVSAFHKSCFQDFDIFVSGNIPENFQVACNGIFGSLPNPTKSQALNPTSKVQLGKSGHNTALRDPKFIQSSIRVGKLLFNRAHSDYIDFMVLNEVLGGFFGSRLMKNIREDKGYTYGIYSGLYSLTHEGYFQIGTDVNAENEKATLDEIKKEIEILQTSLVDLEELEIVKNYMIGTFAGSVNSPFAIIDKFKATHYQGLHLDFYKNYINNVESVTPQRLLDLAQSYLKWEDLNVIAVGPPTT